MTFHLYIYSVNICKAILNAKTDFNQQEKGLNLCASKNSCAYAHQPINRCIKHDALNAMILMLQNPTWTLFYFFSRTLNGDVNIFLSRDLFAFYMVTFCLQPNIYSKIATDNMYKSQFKSINSSVLSFLCSPILTSTHDYWKNHSFDYMDLCWQSVSLLFNMLSRFVIAFLPRSRRLLISWLQSTICSDFGAPQNKVSHFFHSFPVYLPWSDENGCHNLCFLNVEF